jgi:glucan biosynthesis protein C
MTKNETQEKVHDRLYFLDWVRVLAFTLLIFYHTGMMFVDWSFHIESGHNSLFLKSVMMLTSTWRLDVLFVVSGVAISVMVSKMSLRYFAWQRVLKLYIPLIFGVAIVVAPQSYFEALQKGVFDGTFWQFWTDRYFSFSWDERMNAPFPTYNHLWYVLYLFWYTIVLLPLIAYINSDSGAGFLARVESFLSKGARIVWLPLLGYFVLLAAFGDDEITHAFYNDWYGHCVYLFAVVLGLIFVRMPTIWLSFERNRYLSLLIGLTGYLILLAGLHYPGSSSAFVPDLTWGFVENIVKWSWLSLVIGFARHYLNFTNRWLRYCGDIVYPFFILHQTVIIVLGFFVINWGLSGVSEYWDIALGTLVICGILSEILIKPVNSMRLMFGMKRQKPRA